MGDDDINASIAHIVLCCVAGRGIGGLQGPTFVAPGMHGNFFVHGILGFMRYQSASFGDFAPAYTVSYKASRYLPLACLNADLRSGNRNLSVLHLFSGLIPFVLSLTGEENAQLANLVIAINILSLCQYSLKRNKEWGWYTAGAGVVAYFIAPQTGVKVLYPLALAMMEYCAYRVSFVEPELDPRRPH